MADVPKIPVCMSDSVGVGGKLLAVIGRIIKEQPDLNVGGTRKPIYILNGQFVEGDGSADIQISQKTFTGTHIASITLGGTEYKIYNGSSGGGGTTENICVPLLTPMWFDRDPGDDSWIAASTTDLNTSTGAGFFTKASQPKIYEHLLTEYTNAAKATSNKKTISFPYPSETNKTSIDYWDTADGHRICMTDQVTKLNTLFGADMVGTAWFYVLDTANEKFSLPRTKYGFHGQRSYVKRIYEGEQSMRLYFYNGNGPTSADKMDKVKTGIGPFTSTATHDNVATFRDEGQVEDSGHKIYGSGVAADTDLATLAYLKGMIKIVSYDFYPSGTTFSTIGGDISGGDGMYGKTVNIPADSINGYTPIGIAGINVDSGSFAWREFFVNPTNKTVRLVGKCLTNATTKVNVRILCVKSWAFAS